MNQDNAIPELLTRMGNLLKVTTCPPYFKSIHDFRDQVEIKIKYIKQKEKIA